MQQTEFLAQIKEAFQLTAATQLTRDDVESIFADISRSEVAEHIAESMLSGNIDADAQGNVILIDPESAYVPWHDYAGQDVENSPSTPLAFYTLLGVHDNKSHQGFYDLEQLTQIYPSLSKGQIAEFVMALVEDGRLDIIDNNLVCLENDNTLHPAGYEAFLNKITKLDDAMTVGFFNREQVGKWFPGLTEPRIDEYLATSRRSNHLKQIGRSVYGINYHRDPKATSGDILGQAVSRYEERFSRGVYEKNDIKAMFPALLNNFNSPHFHDAFLGAMHAGYMLEAVKGCYVPTSTRLRSNEILAALSQKQLGTEPSYITGREYSRLTSPQDTRKLTVHVGQRNDVVSTDFGEIVYKPAAPQYVQSAAEQPGSPIPVQSRGTHCHP